ncbi:MAG: GNAT family N-acetyltransferase [Ktedonobacteraceae bacterium]|nr:GNAT family N-acetyltransferase [Ktedonobacteraceae bacterium]
MLTETAASATYRRDLGNGLILRWSTPEDTENIAKLSGYVFREKEDEPQNENIMSWIRLLMSGQHPLMGQNDYAVIEDPKKEGNPLVASMCMLRQEWTYEGVPFMIGRPEIVASDPAYRNRGLIRALFELFHARSAAEGHLVQAITGIFYFYRQFGYEYTLDLGGARSVPLSLIPQAKEGESEPYTLRDANEDDMPVILKAYESRRDTGIVWTTLPPDYLRYQIRQWADIGVPGKRSQAQVIIDTSGKVHGFMLMIYRRRGKSVFVQMMEVAPGVNVQAMMPSVLRALLAYGEQMPVSKTNTEPISEIALSLGRNHPVYDALGSLAPTHEPPYTWYVRVADLPAFIKHSAPILQKRLANSAVAGYTGEIKIDFYRGGLRLAFQNGLLTEAEPWRAPIYSAEPSASFPPLVFLQLLFGHRSLDELRAAFPDAWANNDTTLVLKTLFPTRPSYVLPLD